MDKLQVQEANPLLMPDILEAIFVLLDIKDKCIASKVCSTWRNVAYYPSLWRDVIAELNIVDNSCHSILIASLGERNIQHVRLARTNILKDLMQGIPNLKSLYFSDYTHVTDLILFNAFKQEYPHMTKLDMSECSNISTLSIVTITKYFVNLNYLDITNCNNLSDTTLQLIAQNLKKLTWLEAQSCTGFTDDGIEYLSKGSLKLTYLGLNSCQELTSDALFYISEGLQTLNTLNLNYVSDITDDGVEDLMGFENLTNLGLHQTLITNNSLFRLAEGRTRLTLTYLDVSECHELSDVGLQQLAKFKNLKELNLGGCVLITDIGVSFLAKGETGLSLTSIKLNDCDNLSNNILILLATMRQLCNLDLSNCSRITDEGLAYLVECGSLVTSLHLKGCKNVSDNGLKRLASLTNLEKLILNGTHCITDTGEFSLVKSQDEGIWQRTYLKM